MNVPESFRMEIYEVLEAVEAALTREDKMKVIANNDSLGLRDILKVNFNKKIKLNIDKGVNWTPSETHTQSLKDITKHLPALTNTELDKARATKSFKAMLEQIHPMDAQVLQNAAKGKLKYKGLTSALVEEVYGNKFISK